MTNFPLHNAEKFAILSGMATIYFLRSLLATIFCTVVK